MVLAAAGAAAAGAAAATPTSSFLVGVASVDTTGPVADVTLMGYAKTTQTAAGIHTRLRARAFVVGDDAGAHRVAFVSSDIGMGSEAVTREVLARLAERLPGAYSLDTLFVSGTHTHAAPGGFSQYVLPSIPSLGFVRETFEAFVGAAVEAVERAHVTAQPHARVRFGEGAALPRSNINRSPSAYRANPAEERAAYEDGDTEKRFAMLAFERADGTRLGALNFFSVHGTSLPNTNRLVSGDNKGVASQLLEEWLNPPGTLPGEGAFVAAFAATNLGDVSPNVNGTFCDGSGLPCEELHSTCRGLNEFCHGRGPAPDRFESAYLMGERQAAAARRWLEGGSGKYVSGGDVASLSRLVDMGNLTVDLARAGAAMFPPPTFASAPAWAAPGATSTTCGAALGYAFAAGTTDGPGAFDFYQGEKRGNPFWELVRDAVTGEPSDEERACHAPKPLLLPVGRVSRPYGWEPRVVSVGLVRLGRSAAIVSVPSEFTTMAGRRLRRALKRAMVARGDLDEDAVVVVAGLSNGYAHYVTTWEEYQVQRYEGASTLYGPHTLAAYVQEVLALAEDAHARRAVSGDASLRIPDFSRALIGLLPEPAPDRTPPGLGFGDVLDDALPECSVPRAADPPALVRVRFVSANPRHDAGRDSFLTVERLDPASRAWVVVATDASLDTRFEYWRGEMAGVRDVSVATVEWRIDRHNLHAVRAGWYRVTHRGTARAEGGRGPAPFRGVSREFRVFFEVESAVEFERAEWCARRALCAVLALVLVVAGARLARGASGIAGKGVKAPVGVAEKERLVGV